MNPENPLIRPASLADSEGLDSCIDAAYVMYAKRISDMASVTDDCAVDIARNQVRVAVQSDDIIAGLFLAPQNRFMKLAHLAVHSSHGNKGIGRKLIEF